MSAVPLSSRHPHSAIQRVSKSSAKKISFEPCKPSWRTETSYEPSWHTEASYKLSDKATTGGASVMASSQHTNPNDRSLGRTDRWGESKEFGSHNSDRGNARRSLKYSSTASRAENSERIPRHSLRGEDFSETSCSQSESSSLTPQLVPRQPLESGRHSRSRPPLHIGKGQQTKEHTSKKTARPGGQHAVWKALDLASSSPFSRQIERAELPERYTAPRFEIYNGRTDLVAHIGRNQQSMALSRFNDTLMCRLFPSSLREVALRCRKTKEMDALLTMKLEDNETIKEYSSRFWETYNDIDGCDEEVAVRTFKLGLPPDTGLRQSLTKHPAPTVGKLMHRIDQFIRVEKDGGGTTSAQTVAQPKVITPKPSARSNNAAKGLSAPSNFVAPTFRAFETVIKEPIYKLLEKIKREPFFVWPPKLLRKLGLKGWETLFQYADTNLTDKKESSQAVRQPHSSGGASAEVIHVIHNPLCSTISSGSYRSEIQKAAHLRRSFSITDCVHPAPMCTVRGRAMEQIISFSDSDLKDVQLPHNDPLVITLRIGNYDVQRVLIDQGSFAKLLQREPTVPLGKTILPVLAGPINLQTKFIVVKASSPYNAIMGPEQPERVFFNSSNPKLFFFIGSKLSTSDRKQLLQLLMSNRDVFAWSIYDTPKVSPDLAYHVLNISPEHKPVAQKQRKLALERAAIVLEEVERLLESGAIREVQYPIWLSNMVVVKKKNGKWRVCIEFTNLNKACLKDPFPLPRIDHLVDSALGHARLSFLNAFQGYHQIPMSAADQEKTAFITPRGAYCYKVMPFGLKNVGATYQRMVTKMFGHLIGKTVEVYIDDMLIKSLRAEGHTTDLLQVFDILRENRLRLNTSKCTFGVSSGKFSGHVVSRRGIEANPNQIATLVNLAEPRNIKQKLVFFINKAMDETELRYLPLEKAVLTVLQAAKKLPQYFQSSTVTVLSDLPLKMLLQRSDFSGRITKWGVHLGSLDVEYKPWTAIKGQVWAEFLAEFQYDLSLRAGVVLISPEGLVLEQAIRLKFSASNNEAEYEALLIGLKTATKLGASHLQVFCDSQLVANQVSGEYQARDERMSAYLTAARSLLAEFESIHVAQIGREHNSHVDILAKLATALESDIQRTICIETLDQPSFQNQEESVYSISSQPSWMDPILSYLKDNKLPEDKKQANMIKRKALKYWTDALKYVREYDKCQRFAPMIHQPARELNPLSSPWPFAQLFKGFCSDLNIKNFFSSPGYPQSNRQAEVSNKIILNGIKKKLEEAKRKWVEELSSVLWTHRTMVRKSTSETPFALAYGVEAVIPLEVSIPTTRTTDFEVKTNEDNLRKNLDLLEEKRDLAIIRLASYQQQIKREHNKNIKPRVFRVGNLVLRKVTANTRRPNEGKLGSNWEGPYKVISLAGAGSYRLEDLEGKPVPKPWNTCNLRKYFF
uniref:Uncharacterized protein n=1 Tax=Fagus sylvatica TaxID=28930 RepID=A0A2N9FRK2_FAGSY